MCTRCIVYCIYIYIQRNYVCIKFIRHLCLLNFERKCIVVRKKVKLQWVCRPWILDLCYDILIVLTPRIYFSNVIKERYMYIRYMPSPLRIKIILLLLFYPCETMKTTNNCCLNHHTSQQIPTQKGRW